MFTDKERDFIIRSLIRFDRTIIHPPLDIKLSERTEAIVNCLEKLGNYHIFVSFSAREVLVMYYSILDLEYTNYDLDSVITDSELTALLDKLEDLARQ